MIPYLSEYSKVFFPKSHESISLLDDYEDDFDRTFNSDNHFDSDKDVKYIKVFDGIAPLSLQKTLQLIPHKKQISDFDCGLGAASMVLTAFKVPKTSPVEIIRSMAPLESIWTIDICYLLNHHGMSFSILN